MSGVDVGYTTFRAPLYVAWEITHLCNAKCVHCYSDSGPYADRSQELSTNEALGVIDQLAEAGVLILAFSGGEPLLRKDWGTLAEHALRRGLGVNIGSNGSCVTPTVADAIKELGLHSVTISIDSHDPAVHDRFRGLDGLFEKAVSAVRLLAARGVRVVMGFTPTKLNWRDGAHVVRLAADLGAAAVNLSEYVPAGRGAIGLALSPDELRQVLEEWIGLRETYRDVLQVVWHDCRVGMLVADEDRRSYVGCGAGRLVARITPDGTLTPCVFLPNSLGTFREQTFRDMWSNSSLLRQYRERAGHYSGNCGECEHLATCGGCRAVACAYSGGDSLAGDPHCWVKLIGPADLRSLPAGESLPV